MYLITGNKLLSSPSDYKIVSGQIKIPREYWTNRTVKEDDDIGFVLGILS